MENMNLTTHKKVILTLLFAVGLVACTSILTPREGWNESYGPVVPHDTFPADCSMCHISGDWHKLKDDFVFDHEKETGVALNGTHEEASCLLCHNDRGPVAQFAAKGCSGCHEDTHRGKLGKSCSDCHNEQTWRPQEAIAQHARTRFPLVGAHAAAECFRCHEGAPVGNFEGLDVNCATCHTEDLARAVSPDHMAQGWVEDCQRCHVPTNWDQARFDHPGSFPLSGGHSGQSCSICHTGDTFTGLDTDCVSCHLSDYQQTNQPNHITAGFSQNCMECHNINTWQGADFNHPGSFPLSGGHNILDCSACHEGGVFSGLPTDCASCHLSDYQQTTNPNHVTSGFSTDCMTCHNINTWQGADFEHPGSFPLTSGHNIQDCSECHTGGVFTSLPTDCASCHLSDYQQTTNPNHVTSGFNTDCMACHDTSAWQNANFEHPGSFPLTNGHNIQDCSTCHDGGVFTSLPTDCASCHLSDYQQTTNPNHVTSGFGTDCMVCHSTTIWEGADFNHRFPIDSGPHKTLSCSDCHLNPGNQAQFSCTHCHEHTQSSMADDHSEVSGYIWSSPSCLQCHPNGRE